MQVALENNIVFVVIEYLAILCWGLSGGLAAIRKGYDIFTIMLCGWLTALGGGLVRDVMLGALPPVGITDKGRHDSRIPWHVHSTGRRPHS